MTQSAHVLFTAWAAKHKEAIELEDRLAVAVETADPQREALANLLASVRIDAQRRQAAALERFDEELRARGLREV